MRIYSCPTINTALTFPETITITFGYLFIRYMYEFTVMNMDLFSDKRHTYLCHCSEHFGNQYQNAIVTSYT